MVLTCASDYIFGKFISLSVITQKSRKAMLCANNFALIPCFCVFLSKNTPVIIGPKRIMDIDYHNPIVPERLFMRHNIKSACQSTAGGCQFLERATADHRAQGWECLDATDMFPTTLRNRIQHNQTPGLALSLQQSFDSTRLVDGFGIRENEQSRWLI